MTAVERSNLVKAAARRLGLDRCGIAPAGPIEHADFLGRWLATGYAGAMEYLHRHQASRIDVRAWLPWAKSVIVAAMNYNQPSLAGLTEDGRRGRVAMYAWGEDYHVVVREKLEALMGELRGLLGEPFEARVCVDTSAIIERELAAAAGIGWIGKNTLVLHQALGSFFFLGEIITDLELAPDRPEPDHCGSCTRCLEACPTAAFPEPHVMDARRCISYLTIEHRGEIEPELAAKMDDWVFGCDVCQAVCPYNRRAPETTEARFRGRLDAASPLLEDITSWDEAAYREHVRGKATARAKGEMWKRNAEIAKRNPSGPAGGR
ncbi:MAG TPA: tRNA epoxyqueuosine(34) reductase QueG [Phycisphaerae bacterium]|nr:tRNA epoxyqueuosine(34) reductase QueG [Phycisphaerae bacterium]